ncbi:MFS transporter [Nocardioides rotundus]|uniref:MFS transporter n=1 Tax=Nocardioides rotundus TaxID=1774216 RepID=UPI001CBF3F01|nr:MFS transporter [Nocardioides rotundus]UAL29451.1 MFS transporter [Nocardioides rotundus]
MGDPIPGPGPAPAVRGYAAGTREYRRLTTALWLAGAGTFMVLYSVQALLPLFSHTFHVSPATSSLALSAATGTLALAIIPVSAIAEQWGRRRVMTVSLSATAAIALLTPLAPSFEVLLALRALQGLAMAGVPALAMGHLTQEVEGRSLGHAMGLLIAGNTAGGLSGRLLAGWSAELAGWRTAMAVVGVACLLALVGFRLLIPTPRQESTERATLMERLAGAARLLTDPGVRRACAVSFWLMAAFVTMYNYLGYRLLEPPYSLSHGLVGLVFLAYLAGTVSSPVAGALGDRIGRLRVLALAALLALASALLSLAEPLALVLVALVLYTMGFFGAHSAASGWLNERAGPAAAQASALYLFCYYAGSSLGGTAGGVAYQHGAWPGVVGYLVALLLLALVATWLLTRLPGGRRAVSAPGDTLEG